MDVTFIETESYFPPPQCPVQGETSCRTRQWWEVGIAGATDGYARPHDSKAAQSNNTELLYESEQEQQQQPSLSPPSSPSSVPLQTPENVPEVSSSTVLDPFEDTDMLTGYKLPDRHNRGKPPNRYSPYVEDRR